MPDLLEKPKPKKGKKVDVNSLIDDSDVMVDVNDLIEKKNGTSNGLTNGEDVATTSVPSTSQSKLVRDNKGDLWEYDSLDDKFVPILLNKSDESITRNDSRFGELNKKLHGSSFSETKTPLPVNDPFSFDRFIPKKIDNAQDVVPSDNTHDTSPDSTQLGFDRFIPKKLDNRPALAATLEDAHVDDMNFFGNLRNRLLTGLEKLQSGSADLVFSVMNKVLPQAVLGDKTPEEMTKLYREQVIPQIEGSLTKTIGADVTAEQKKQFDENFWSSSIGGLAESSGAILSPKGMKGVALLMQAYDSGIKSINSTEEGQKLSEDTKTGFGLAVGMTQAALEKYGLDKIFGKMSTKAASNLAVKTLTDLIKKSDVPITAEVFEQALGVAAKTLKKQVIDAGGKVGKAGIIEFATGTAQEFSTVGIEELTNAATGKQVFDKASWLEQGNRILYAGAQEAVGGGILGTASIPFSTTRNYIAEKVAVAKTPEDVAALKTELMATAENKKLSEPETQQLSETIDNYIRVNQKIPPDTESRKEIAEKIIEREDIENEITKKLEEVVGVDEAFKPAIREESEALKGRAAEITDEIKNLASPSDTKLSEPIEGLDEQGIPVGENVPQPTDGSIERTDSNAPLLEQRSEEDISNIIKAPVPTGKLKRMEVQVKSIDPETNEVTLTTMHAKKAVVDLKKQVGIIDMIKKCL